MNKDEETTEEKEPEESVVFKFSIKTVGLMVVIMIITLVYVIDSHQDIQAARNLLEDWSERLEINE